MYVTCLDTVNIYFDNGLLTKSALIIKDVVNGIVLILIYTSKIRLFNALRNFRIVEKQFVR